MKKLLLPVFAAVLLFGSCKKDEKDKGSGGGSSTEKTLSDKKWKLTGWRYSVEGMGELDGFGSLPSCQTDNTMTFKSDKTNEVDEGPTKCNPASPQTTTAGRWELKSGETEILVTGFEAVFGISSMTLTIISIDESTLKVRYNTEVGGPKVINYATYTNVD